MNQEELERLLDALPRGDLTPDEWTRLCAHLDTQEGRAAAGAHLWLETSLHEVHAAAPFLRTISEVRPSLATRFRAALVPWWPARPWIPAAAALALGALGVWSWHVAHPSMWLTQCQGAVSVERDGRIFTAAEKTPLRNGDIVHTPVGGKAGVRWQGEATAVDLREDSRLRLATVGGGKKLELLGGSLSADVARQSSEAPMHVLASRAEAVVLGTRFELSLVADDPHLAVDRGRVLWGRSEGGEAIIVSAAQRAGVDATGAPAMVAVPMAEKLRLGLVGHWSFDEGAGQIARDVTGNSAPFDLLDGATWSEGRQGTALDLRMGGGARARSAVPWRLPEVFTLSLWLWLEQETSEKPTMRTLLANAAIGHATKGFRLFVHRQKAKVPQDRAVFFETGTGTLGACACTAPGAFPFGRWCHLGVVVNRRESTAVLWIDGQQASVTTGILADFATDAPLVLGRLAGAGHGALVGRLDELLLYDRLLSAQEIRALTTSTDL